MHRRTDGAVAMPIVIRIPYGGGIGAVEHHSESPEAYFAHTAGLRVLTPSDPQAAYVTIQQAIACDDPVVFFEPKRRYWDKGEVDESLDVADRYARPTRGGPAFSGAGGPTSPWPATARWCAPASRRPRPSADASLEVIDLQSLSPLDIDTLAASVERTGRLVVVHEASANCRYRRRGRCAGHRAVLLLARGAGPARYRATTCPTRRAGWRSTSCRTWTGSSTRSTERWRSEGGAAVSEVRAFAMPDVGEGLTEAEILRWPCVRATSSRSTRWWSRSRRPRQSVELPVPLRRDRCGAACVRGDVVPVGTPIISITTLDVVGRRNAQSVLVGYGVRADGPSGRRRASDHAGRRARDVSAAPSRRHRSVEAAPVESGPVRAKPPVRKLARDHGDRPGDAHADRAAGRGDAGGRARCGGGGALTQTAPPPAARVQASTSAPRPQAGEKVPVRGVHRAMAEAMVQSAFTAPHVTEWVDVDMSRSLELLARVREHPAHAEVRHDADDPRRARAGPGRSAATRDQLDVGRGARRDAHQLHRDVNLGIAADTPRGLLVPTIPQAGGLGLVGARTGRPADHRHCARGPHHPRRPHGRHHHADQRRRLRRRRRDADPDPRAVIDPRDGPHPGATVGGRPARSWPDRSCRCRCRSTTA